MTGYLTQTSAPATGIVTLTEAKEHLRVDDTSEDTLINTLILAASSAAQEMAGKALVSQSWQWQTAQPTGRVSLPMFPIETIDAITYQDADDATQSLTVSDFRLFGDQNSAAIEPKDGISWPSMHARPDALSITFTAGFGDISTVPDTLKTAALLLIAHWFENRMAVSVGKTANAVPMGVQYLIEQNRKVRI